MVLLKPGGRFRRLAFGLQHLFHVVSEGRIGQRPFELVPRDSLQNNPGVMGQLP